MGVIFFISTIILFIMYNNRNSEITELKRQLSRVPKFCAKCGYQLNGRGASDHVHVEVDESSNVSDGYVNMGNYKESYIQHPSNRKSLSDSEWFSKNNIILLTGSFLIVLASIIFLTTTWDSIGNIVKIVTIYLLLVVFLYFSKIAKDKFNLKNTSDAFFYIGLSYLPLSFFGLSFFRLIGEDFAINSIGCLAYFGIVSVLLGFLYMYIAKIKNNEILSIVGIVFEFISIIFFKGYFNLNLNLYIVFNLLLTNIIMLLSRTGGSLLKKDKLDIINYIALTCCSVLCIAINLSFESASIMPFVSLLLICINVSSFIENKKYTKILNCFMIIYFMLLLGLNLSVLSGEFIFTEILMIISPLVIFAYDYFYNKDTKFSNSFYISLGVYALFAVVYAYDISLPVYIYLYAYTALNVILFLFRKHNLYLCLSIISFLSGIAAFLIYHELSAYYLLAISLFVFISALVIDDKKKSIFMQIISAVFCSVLYLFLYDDTIIYFGFLLIACLIIIYKYINNKKYLVCSLAVSNVTIYTMLNLLAIDGQTFDYLLLVLMLCCSCAYYIYSQSKIPKALCYVAGLILIEKIIGDIGFEDVAILTIGSAYLIIIVFLYDIVKKFTTNEGFEGAQYLAYILINIISLFSYADNTDGLLFVILLLALTIYGYSIKNKSMFYVNLAFIVINILLLTIDFWLSIPWWIYILTIGLSLVGFAVHNEIKKNQDRN